MENKNQPFGPDWEKEMSKLTFPELVRLFKLGRKSNELKADYIKRLGRIKLEAHAGKRGFYIISLVNTLRHEEFITLWRPENSGYTFYKDAAGIYLDPKPGYHDSDDNMAIKINFVKTLFVERRIDGKIQLVIPNIKSTWEKLGVEMESLHLIRR